MVALNKLLKEKFLSIIVWYCADDRLELAFHDAVMPVSRVNRFKSFIDKLYVLYNASPKIVKNYKPVLICWKWNF
jgi:hypothetical protein